MVLHVYDFNETRLCLIIFKNRNRGGTNEVTIVLISGLEICHVFDIKRKTLVILLHLNGIFIDLFVLPVKVI